jgi:hypothetical protein
LKVTPAEYIAYLFKNRGPEYTKEILEGLVNARGDKISYEFLSECANELRSVDLPAAATVVEAVAQTTRHMWDLPAPFPWDCDNLIAEWKAEVAVKRKAFEASGALQNWRTGRS